MKPQCQNRKCPMQKLKCQIKIKIKITVNMTCSSHIYSFGFNLSFGILILTFLLFDHLDLNCHLDFDICNCLSSTLPLFHHSIIPWPRPSVTGISRESSIMQYQHQQRHSTNCASAGHSSNKYQI